MWNLGRGVITAPGRARDAGGRDRGGRGGGGEEGT